MGSFLARRLAATLPVLLVVAVLVFLMLRLTPGDPAAVLAGDAASTEQIARIRAGLGLDRSLPEQFAIWVGRMLTGDLGPVVLLQDAGHRTDRPAHRADGVAGAC